MRGALLSRLVGREMDTRGLAVGNVAGRVVWGWLYDRIGYRTIPAALVLLCLAIGGVMAASTSPAAFIAAGGLVGFGFGACFVLYAAHLATTHGVDQVGRLYPFLFLSYGIAGPFLGGLLYDWTGRYSASLVLAALVAALGARMTWRPPADGPERGAHGISQQADIAPATDRP